MAFSRLNIRLTIHYRYYNNSIEYNILLNIIIQYKSVFKVNDIIITIVLFTWRKIEVAALLKRKTECRWTCTNSITCTVEENVTVIKRLNNIFLHVYNNFVHGFITISLWGYKLFIYNIFLHQYLAQLIWLLFSGSKTELFRNHRLDTSAIKRTIMYAGVNLQRKKKLYTCI